MPVWVGWTIGALLGIAALVLLRRPLRAGLRLIGRVAVGLAGLFAFGQVGSLIGVGIGVNLLNALVIALLGVPGLGLLLMVNWILQV